MLADTVQPDHRPIPVVAPASTGDRPKLQLLDQRGMDMFDKVSDTVKNMTPVLARVGQMVVNEQNMKERLDSLEDRRPDSILRT
jgi:hypothetical protein